MKKFIHDGGNAYGYTPEPFNPPERTGGCGANDEPGAVMASGCGGTGEHTETPLHWRPVTECNECGYYNRGECGRSGLEMGPEDFCSRPAPAEE